MDLFVLLMSLVTAPLAIALSTLGHGLGPVLEFTANLFHLS